MQCNWEKQVGNIAQGAEVGKEWFDVSNVY